MYDDDDQCAQCGGVRVAKSTLCADCLVACNKKLWIEGSDMLNKIVRERERAQSIISGKNIEIEDLKYKRRLHKKLLRRIFREYQSVRGIKAIDVLQ